VTFRDGTEMWRVVWIGPNMCSFLGLRFRRNWWWGIIDEWAIFAHFPLWECQTLRIFYAISLLPQPWAFLSVNSCCPSPLYSHSVMTIFIIVLCFMLVGSCYFLIGFFWFILYCSCRALSIIKSQCSDQQNALYCSRIFYITVFC
jgi:hypothetical protein